MDIPEHKLEIFELWIYISKHSSSQDRHIIFPKVLQPLIDQDELFPNAVHYFNEWTEDEWKFFCLVISINNVFSHKSIVDLKPFSDEFRKEKRFWKDEFEKHFRKIHKKEEAYIGFRVTQLHVTSQFIEFDSWFVKKIFFIDLNEIYKNDVFSDLFKLMWEEYIKNDDAIKDYFFQIQSYFLCHTLFSFEQYRTKPMLYLKSPHGLLFSLYMQKEIIHRLELEYEITFVESEDLANLIIVVEAMEEETFEKSVRISRFLSNHDYNRLEAAIEDLFD